MTLLDQSTYRRITSDTVVYGAGILDGALADGQRRVEDYLRRPVELAERTEFLRTSVHRYLDSDFHRFFDPVTDQYYGERTVYPQVTPITIVPAGYTIRTSAAVVIGPDWNGYLTYTGGWTLSTAPYCVLEGLAWAAYAVLMRTGAAGMGEQVDPEGNVIPVVPPFSQNPGQVHSAELRKYVRRSDTV